MYHHAVHLVRRVASTYYEAGNPQNGFEDIPEYAFKFPAWGAVLTVGTVLVFMFLTAAVQYTYEHVVATLTMVESPYQTVIIKAEESTDPDAPLSTPIEKSEKAPLIELETVVVRTQPVTAKFRTAIKHLNARAGRLSRFRGLGLHCAYHFVHHILTVLTMAIMPTPRYVSRPIGYIAAAVILSRWQLAWTHIVISEPSTKPACQRIPGRNSWKKVAPATALWAASTQLTVGLPMVLGKLFGFHELCQRKESLAELTPSELRVLFIQVSLVFLVFIGTAVAILVPATVTMRRVHASMLPEEDEPIVSFDRTFDGKVIPEILGGSGKVDMLEAWKSFDMSSRIRLLKTYGKVFAIQLALSILGALIVFGELALVMGHELPKMIAAVKGSN
ncbi:MAG: hypothetical protein M1834_009710 [Cirrosporium novae-zelandiae]|nr:MAG: hypothetical protein M1834_009710 [Cirrosporium novae-zelandiae]